MRASINGLPTHLRKPIRDLLAAGGSVARDGSLVLIDGPEVMAEAVRAHSDELVRHVIPSVGVDQAKLVRDLLADAGASLAYVTTPGVARQAVAAIVAGAPDVIGLDFETEVLPAFRQPIPIKFNKDGNIAARQPRDGAAGIALDPYRSKVRLVQAWAGGEHCYVFDMRSVAWTDIAPLFALPLAIFNAVFEVKRLIHEAQIEPTGRIYDVMTAVWLTDGRRPSLAEAIAINYKITLPKELGASDWSSDILTAEQLEYAALDAVLCYLLWNTQQNELFDDIDWQCQEVVDAVIPAIARMELHGMPIDVAAHRAQIVRWQTELAAAEKELHHASPSRDLLKPAQLQAHLYDVLDAESLTAWPRTDTGKLTTKRQQLQINSHIPALTELLKVRALQKLINAFGESLIEAINPVTGRLHTKTGSGRRWRWKWLAQNPEDVDEDTPFYEDAIVGFRGSYAVNHPVQGSSAEVMQIALTRLDQALRDEPAQIIATVHDEAVLLVPDDVDSVERLGAIAQREMIAAFLEVFPDAPTLNLVDPTVGPTWGDLQSLMLDRLVEFMNKQIR
jgi:DNA polymerase family A/3'-5' exonuclease